MLNLISKTFGLFCVNSFTYNMVALKVGLWGTVIDVFFVYNPDESIVGFIHDMEPKEMTESQRLFISYVYDNFVDVPQYS